LYTTTPLQVRTFLGPAHRRDASGPAACRATIANVPGGTKVVVPLAADGGALGLPTVESLRAAVAAFLAHTATEVPIRA